MKKNTLLYMILLSVLITSSCTKELIQYPETEKVAGNFYRNEEEMEEAVNATYAALQEEGVYDIALLAIGEIPGEDAYDETPANDGGVYGMLDTYTVIPTSSLIASVWEESFIGIQRANIVLNRIQTVSYSDEATRQSRIGEMQFIRALLYFNLVRIFGDVPLVVDEVDDPQTYFGQGRTDKTEVYTQIKADLSEAIANLPIRTEANKNHVFRSAAQTLLGKVELTLGNHAKAREYLLAVVEQNPVHALLDDPGQVFALSNELNKEIIFSVQFASGINSNSEGTDAYRMFNPTGRVEGNMAGTKGHGVLKGEFYSLYTSDDKRKDVYVKTLASGLAYNNKIAVPTTVITDSGSDFVVLRYADVLLMLAEIENELGDPDAAIGYLDKIRLRADIGEYAREHTKEAVFAEIDLQRRKELVFEGHRWFDILRTGRARTVLGITNEDKLLLPIPASQIAADKSIIQNLGY